MYVCMGLYLVHRQKQKSQPGDVESVLPAISSRTVDVVIFARYDCCVLFIHLSPLHFLILVSASFFLSLSLSLCLSRARVTLGSPETHEILILNLENN